MITRIHGERVSIDADRVRHFFEQRFCAENPLASVMVRPNPDDGIAEKRNANEAALVNELLEGRSRLHILDLGCGMGRWADILQHRMASYTGVDFAENYIAAAKEMHEGKKGVLFQHCSVVEPEPFILTRKYDLVIINGLCVYLNDEDVETVFGHPILAAGGLMYCRESVSVTGARLTLKNFFSEELHVEYNAVYRTPEEYEKILKEKLPDAAVRSSGFLLDKDTGARQETNQKYWLLER